MAEAAQARYDLFVSYAEADQTWVKGYLLDALKAAGVHTHSEEAFRLGAPRLLEFEQAVKDSQRTLLVLTPAYLAEGWNEVFRLMAQSYDLDQEAWRVIPLRLEAVELPPGLATLIPLDATDPAGRDRALERLCADLQRPVPAPAPPPACPYPGMRPFSEEEKDCFCGRDAELEQMVKALRKHPFLAVIGPSGSGKSSLVFAGLVPKLRESGLFGGGSWQVIILRPGKTPAQSLADRIKGDVNQPAQAISDLLSSQPGARRLLLVVDQFEELFTQADAGEVAPFQEALLRLTDMPDCYVVLTVRADFYGDLMTSLLWRQIERHRAEVLPLDEEGLRQAIVRPAERRGVFVDPFLVERLVSDAAGEPGLLPFVQETLVLLWEKLERRYLPLSAYDEMSDLRAAMAQHADEVLDTLTREEEAIARRTLLRLVQFGEGRADTRRQQAVAELRSSRDDATLFDRTLAHLAKNRLITLGGAEKGEQRWVDLAHEALIEGWPALHGWVGARREAEQTRRRLEGKARDWVRLKEKGGGLLDEVELREAQEWLESPDAEELGGASDALGALVEGSRAALEAVAREKEEVRQRELKQALALAEEQRLRAEESEARRAAEEARARDAEAAALAQRRSSARLRRLVFGLILVLIIALIAAWLAIRQGQIAKARSLIAQSQLHVRNRDLNLATLLALEAQAYEPNEAERILGNEIPATFSTFVTAFSSLRQGNRVRSVA